MYYNSSTSKFRCYEAGAWKDCISAGPTAASFTDSTPGTWADADTTELFNDGTKPNITTTATTSSVQVSLFVNGTSNNTADTYLSARVVYTSDGSTPSCSTSTQVGQPMVANYTTASGVPFTLGGTFVFTPAAAATIKFTVCTSATSSGTVTATPSNVILSLVAINQ
jgi:hypothetical protein